MIYVDEQLLLMYATFCMLVLQVDLEIKRIMSESYERAKSILRAHAREHKAIADALLKYETLDADDIKAIMTGERVNHGAPHESATS